MWNKLGVLLWPSRGLRLDLAEVRALVDQLVSAPSLDAVAKRIADLESLTDDDRSRIVTLEGDIDAIAVERKDLILAISEGIERTDRAERRIRSTVKRAKAELVKRGYVDPGLESEDYDLREIDGERSDREGVPPVRSEVARTEPAPSSIRGVPLELLRNARGIA